MSVQQGMDTARIREIADQLRAQRAKIDDVRQTGTASMGVLKGAWEGADLESFGQQWDGDAVRRLTEASTQIGAAADLMVKQAEQQEDTSTTGTAGPGGSTGTPGTGGVGASASGSADGKYPGDSTGTWSPFDRGKDSPFVRTNTDEHGNKHHYDPLTGKRWVEDAEGKWTNYTDPTGHSSLTTKDKTDHGNGWETSRESTRGEGGGRREYGESWTKERDFDENIGSRAKDVLDNVQSEPFVEKGVSTPEAHVAVGRAEVGDAQTGASIEALSAEANADAAVGIDATRGAYAEANAEAGAYLLRGEAHWANEHGTSANVEGFVGGEAEAGASAQIGPGGAAIEAGGEAFVGGKVEAGVSQDIGEYGNVGVNGSLSYGIGAEANVDAEFSWDRIGFGGEVGLTLGVGGSIDVDLSISPKKIIDDLTFWD